MGVVALVGVQERGGDGVRGVAGECGGGVEVFDCGLGEGVVVSVGLIARLYWRWVMIGALTYSTVFVSPLSACALWCSYTVGVRSCCHYFRESLGSSMSATSKVLHSFCCTFRNVDLER